MTAMTPQPPSTLADACRVAVVSLLAYAVAIGLVAAGIPAFLRPLETGLSAARPLPAVARTAPPQLPGAPQ